MTGHVLASVLSGDRVLRWPLSGVPGGTGSPRGIVNGRSQNKPAFTGSASEVIGIKGSHALSIVPVDAKGSCDLDWAHQDPFDRRLMALTIRLG